MRVIWEQNGLRIVRDDGSGALTLERLEGEEDSSFSLWREVPTDDAHKVLVAALTGLVVKAEVKF